MSARYYVIAILLATLLSACTDESTQPPPNGPSIGVEVLDATCTEAWIAVQLAAGLQPRALTLQRDSQTVLNLTLTGADTLIVDDGLLPSRSYSYALTRDNGGFVERVTANATTMDTTSHNFTWHMDTLGVTSSVLSDVAIINDTLAYVVGEMYLRDSSGQTDPIRYNAAIWNGDTWDMRRIPYVYAGHPVYNPIQTVFAFSSNDIWFAGNGVLHWNGQEYVPIDISSVWGPYQINKIWGRSSSDLYIVGNEGAIAHYNGATWRRIASGTTLPIMGVHGESDSNGGYEILGVAEDYGVPGGSKVLSIQGSNVNQVLTDGLQSWGVSGIWFVPNREYIVVGQGVWRSRSPLGSWELDGSLPTIATTSICGPRLNDIVVCGAFGLLVHWNGIHWQTLLSDMSGSFTSVQMRDNLIVAVGGLGTKAIVARGRR